MNYFDLAPDEKIDLLQAASSQSALSPLVYEKDIWVVWALQNIFKHSDSSSFVFKGGTSLSKCYAAISRFSEDIDLTIDATGVDDGLPEIPLDFSQSKTQLRGLRGGIQEWLGQYLSTTIGPFFEAASARLPEQSRPEIEVDAQNGVVNIKYPTINGQQLQALTFEIK